MNNQEFTYLLQNPSSINASHTEQLEELIKEFPYFQASRALQLKGLNSTNSFKYNQTLKKTAAYTIDRSVLFDFITSQNFTKSFDETQVLEEIEVVDPETIEVLHNKIKASFSDELTKEEVLKPKEATKILEIGKPIEFNSTEPHSFNEWMQLISQKPIIREESLVKEVENLPKSEEKNNLIDRFIELNPKIKPVDKNTINQAINFDSYSENESLMTVTLAKVYLEQKKYESAIKAYRILSLKYPEKSGFFADRIKAIKILQKNKS